MGININRRQNILAIVVAIIVIGSIWVVCEMIWGGLHAIHFPQEGAVMGGLAISFMAIFTSLTGKLSFVPLLGIIAASFKPLDAIVFGVPIESAYVINPAVAIIWKH